MRMNAFGYQTRLLEQRVPVTPGHVYELSGWMRTPNGPNKFCPNSGNVQLLFQFRNANGVLGPNITSPIFSSNGPTTWTLFQTGPALAPAAATEARVVCRYYSGGDWTTNGWVDFDDIRFTPSEPTKAGALVNPDFDKVSHG